MLGSGFVLLASYKNIWNSCVLLYEFSICLFLWVILLLRTWMQRESRLCDTGSGHDQGERNFAWLTYPLLGCGNLVPIPTHTTSGETLACASRSLPKGLVVHGFVHKPWTFEPGSGLLEPKNGSIVGTWRILREGSGNSKAILEAGEEGNWRMLWIASSGIFHKRKPQ